MKLSDFIEAVAAKTPTPGGGAVAAAACALGAALGTMAARFSAGPEAQHAAGVLEELKSTLVPLVDQDAQAYNLVSAAYGLPKGNDDEKKRRKEAIQNALKEAAEVPLKVMMISQRALEALVEFAPHCNKNLISDLASGSLMLSAGVEGASHNVRINASGLVDKTHRERLETEDRRLFARTFELRARVLGEVETLRQSDKK
ncbi:MAG: cyclodeaminase/cyclohydrolase family protein [Planctomycetes bacterium]|nr:cyclodeaminase/cyclohydrolase family protein [Planctomycetota bacterium]